MKKFLAILCAMLIASSMTACATPDNKTNIVESSKDEIIAQSELKVTGAKGDVGYQLNAPEVGEEIAVITTNMGVIKMKFFPEVAPKTVYNFKKLAQTGYFDGIVFHRVMEDFMIQGGDPTATGTAGQSIWGQDFEDEYSDKVLNIRGAVAMANTGAPMTNGSQFFINTANIKIDWALFEQYQVFNPTKLTAEIKEFYDENGGNPTLDGALTKTGRGHTVFAQVIEGIEVAEAISKVDTNPDNNKPLEDVVMEKVEIVKYEG